MRKYSFATLISCENNQPLISHLPLLLDSKNNVLLGHCARANTHWQKFGTSKVTAIFHGPHAYISPAWYIPKEGNVPTWNYVVVHLRGSAKVVEDPQEIYQVLNQLTEANENVYGTGWKLNPNTEINRLQKTIVAFKIEIEEVQAKFKLSQNQVAENRNEVIKQLGSGDDFQSNVAHWMKLFR